MNNQHTISDKKFTKLSELSGYNEFNNCSFEDLNLAGLKFDSTVRFVKCNFSGSNMKRAVLSGPSFIGCTMQDVIFCSSQLQDAQFENCRMIGVDFSGAKLNNATFLSCDLNNCIFAESNLFVSSFSQCKLMGANFQDAGTTGLKIDDCNCRYTNFRFKSFQKQTINGVDFSDADLTGCSFFGAVLNDCTLTNANLHNTVFDNADLTGCNLVGFDISNCKSIKGAIISSDQAVYLLEPYGIKVV